MSVSSSVPERRGATGGRARGLRRRFSPWLALPLILAAVVAGTLIWQTSAARSRGAAVTTATVARGDLTVLVTGSGAVQPARSLDMPFQVSGKVTDVLVEAGDAVTQGQPLATLDTRALELAVQQAEAGLKSAEAKLAESRGEGATPQDVQQAKLALQAAEIQLQKTEKGDPVAADLRSAQANLQSAQAKLAALTAPAPVDASAAETRLSQAQAQLQSTRDDQSAAKTRAELSLQQAVASLTQAQARYATAKQQWEYVQDTGNNPTQPDTTNAQGNKVANKVNDGQRQQYYDTFVQAEAALHSAEASVQQAQLAYDNARQQEASAVAQAEQSARDAQVQYDALRNPSPDALATARASVTQAQAQLDKLRSGGTANDIAAAQIQVEQARLSLDKLTAPASAATIAAAEASVTQAQAQLEAARLDLEHATLVAPFDGVITAVSVIPSQIASTGTAAISIADPSSLSISMNLSETDAARAAEGQPVALSFDALPNQPVQGVVQSIAPIATVQQNVVTYQVRVRFDPGSVPVKIGMSATGDIQVEQHKDVLLVPSRAVQTQGSQRIVQVRPAPGQAIVPVQVEVGLSSNGQVEILSCVETGAQCLREGDTLVIPATTAAAGQRTQAGGFGGPPSGGILVGGGGR